MRTHAVQRWLKERGLGYSRDSLYRYVREKGFPAPTRIGVRASWSAQSLDRWDTLRRIAPNHIIDWAKAHEQPPWKDTVREWSRVTGHQFAELETTRFLIHELETGRTLYRIPFRLTLRDRVKGYLVSRRDSFLDWVMRKVG
jgi:predicted DNA-binding transcriptional regulator AlpA